MPRDPRVPVLVAGIVAAACTPSVSPAEAFARGQDPAVPLVEALDWCLLAGEAADTCVVGAVRAHGDADTNACERARDARLRAECHFSRAEARARDGDRWGAVEACARAGAYGDECLYHAWSLELQHVAEAHPDTARAWAAMHEPLTWWAGLQTVGPDAATLVARDAWYFLGVVAQARGTPVGWATCEAVAPEHRAECRDGVAGYVARAAREGLRRASEDVRDALCRRVESDPDASVAARAALGVDWVAAPDLRVLYEGAVREGCRTPDAPRPWNPVFQPRRRAPAVPT